MKSDRKVLWVLGAVVAVGFLAVLLYPQAKEGLAPELAQAWVAIEPAGSGVATVGPVEIEAGASFTLHAVLEARGRGGAVYYTQAPALRVGGELVPPESLRRWDRLQEARMLWLTVEGAVPYLKLKSIADFERFRWTEFLRLDWPKSWSIPGSIDPAHGAAIARPEGWNTPPFGTQRYQVRIELYDTDRQLIPTERFSSWAGDQLPERVAEFPTVYAGEPGAAGAASLFFGLTHVEVPPDSTELLPRLDQLTRQRLAYEPVSLLSALLEAAGTSFDRLTWRRVDLEAGPPWGDGEEAVAAGDLLRVGERWVVLYRDAEGGDRPGVLDGADLCLDFGAGATVRPLDEVFTGEGEIELAELAAPA